MRIILHLFCLLVAARRFSDVRGRERRPDTQEISERYCHIIYTVGLQPLDGKRKYPGGRSDWNDTLKPEDEVTYSMYKQAAKTQWTKGRIIAVNYDLGCVAVYSLEGGQMPVIVPIEQVRKPKVEIDLFTK